MNAVCLRSSSIIDVVAPLSVSESNMTFLFSCFLCMSENVESVNKFKQDLFTWRCTIFLVFFSRCKWPLVLTFLSCQIVNWLEYGNYAMRRSGLYIALKLFIFTTINWTLMEKNKVQHVSIFFIESWRLNLSEKCEHNVSIDFEKGSWRNCDEK